MCENVAQAVSDGAVIAVVGMVVVFAFLTIMVFAMDITSKIVEFLNKKFPPKVVEQTTAKKKVPLAQDEAVAIAIAAVLNLNSARR